MAWVDFVILAVLIAAMFGGFAQGFLRSVFSLAGLFFGIALADWNYARVATVFRPIVRIEQSPTDRVPGDCAVVMATANVVGGDDGKNRPWNGTGLPG